VTDVLLSGWHLVLLIQLNIDERNNLCLEFVLGGLHNNDELLALLRANL
jgi:hypothetical protein